MANLNINSTLPIDEILESREIIEDDETYEDYMDSFTEDDPF